MKVRALALGLVLAICAGCIAIIFWNQEMKYQLPTPVPSKYVSVIAGKSVSLPANFKTNRAYFFHFYNPDCPCSRFNARHLKSLIRSYSDSVSIVIVVSSEDDLAKAKKEFNESLHYFADRNQALAKSCGVYSTPQAAIVDAEGKLFYRGNYNRSRYCTARATNFAELSLIALLNNQPSPSFGLLAAQSYGCELSKGGGSDFELF